MIPFPFVQLSYNSVYSPVIVARTSNRDATGSRAKNHYCAPVDRSIPIFEQGCGPHYSSSSSCTKTTVTPDCFVAPEISGWVCSGALFLISFRDQYGCSVQCSTVVQHSSAAAFVCVHPIVGYIWDIRREAVEGDSISPFGHIDTADVVGRSLTTG